MRLISKTTNKTLVPKLEIADNVWSRGKGLLGRSSLPEDQALLLMGCNNIHTFFMKFPIDLVFLNSKMVVTKTVKGVGPGRMVFAMLSSSHVVEFQGGFLDKNPIQPGEQLHVDHTVS
jgi:uncharacterized protein